MTETPLVGERAVLLDYLGHYRSALEAVCADLDAEQMAQQAVPPSNLSLLGLVRHLARVERAWFFRTMQHHPDEPKLYWTPEQPDLDFEGAVADPACVEDAWATWRREVAAAEEYVATASLDDQGTHPDGPLELREVLVHMIEEYARHLGHADLLRECIDGRTGL